jgi:hypothetical protein
VYFCADFLPIDGRGPASVLAEEDCQFPVASLRAIVYQLLLFLLFLHVTCHSFNGCAETRWLGPRSYIRPLTTVFITRYIAMDALASDVSSVCTASSTADLTPADSSSAQTLTDRTERKRKSTMSSSDQATDDSDSDSDVSMSASTDEEDNQIHSSNSTEVLDKSRVLGKRKHSTEPPTSQLDFESNNEVRKRVKPSGPAVPYRTQTRSLCLDKPHLPPEVWHRVFTFCHPRVLGALLRVNKSFNSYIDPSSTASPAVVSPKYVLQLLSPDAIWRASRLLFHNGMPGPLAGRSELEMWKLACSSKCQFCGKTSKFEILDQWHPGPGENGVARIWTFGVRSCGLCLEGNTTKVNNLTFMASICHDMS